MMIQKVSQKLAMAKLLVNFGSLNIDHVYNVPHIVNGGETISSSSFYETFGGKGANQSVALANGGAKYVHHAGKVGKDGDEIVNYLKQRNVNVDFVEKDVDLYTGKAIIQVSELDGENGIILSPGYKVILNPTPITHAVKSYALDLVDILIVNRTEGIDLCGLQNASDEQIVSEIHVKYPQAIVVMTIGKDGSLLMLPESIEPIRFSAEKIEIVVDTTGAGDTFIVTNVIPF
ncbi:hypothetical protein HK098_001221 [Nowakowskiella sp. JEL0407]|nr:hypothetical protein HK098_001221 [Nowakowskiella sp. JEL0407]